MKQKRTRYDKFGEQIDEAVGGSSGFFLIVPSNTNKLPKAIRGFYVNAPGDVVAVNEDGEDVTFSVLQGGYVGCITDQIKSTGTTATIVGMP